MPRSKWDILIERRQEAEQRLKRLEDDIAYLRRTSFGRECSGCGELLATEEDFAKHFLIRDERYINLGYCPKRDPHA